MGMKCNTFADDFHLSTNKINITLKSPEVCFRVLVVLVSKVFDTFTSLFKEGKFHNKTQLFTCEPNITVSCVPPAGAVDPV